MELEMNEWSRESRASHLIKPDQVRFMTDGQECHNVMIQRNTFICVCISGVYLLRLQVLVEDVYDLLGA